MVRMPLSRPGATAMLLSVMFAAGGAMAQAQDPGAQPIAAVGAGVATVPTPAAAVAPQGAVAGALSTPAPAATEKRPPRVKSAAPPRELTVASGQNTVFSVALFHVNRIVTPFRNPEVRTSSAATMTIENGILYITTQTEDPIGLFVFEKTSPEQAISLTLNPAAISPVSVSIRLDGWTPTTASYAIPGNQTKARSWETSDPYIDTVKALFKDLANNKIPEGYGLSPLPGRYQWMPNCAMPGLQVVPMQLLEGAEITAVIARVTNVSYQPVEIAESSCQSSRLIGAASWPRNTLNPGESTELYIAIQTPHEVDSGAQRPSVLTGRGY